MVARASAPVFMFCAPGLFFCGTEGVESRFHVLQFRTRFAGTEGVPSRFHVLCSRTCFRRYRVRRVPFSCFALADSFLAVPRESCPVFIFCAPGLVFGYAECVGSRFHVLCSRTRLRRYRWRRVPSSRFARPESFSAVPSATGPVFTFCALGLVFSGTGELGPIFLFCAP
jgi:hypothetical protein